VLETLTSYVSGSPVTYLVVFALVAGDAIVPLFPGESAVVAAAVLAADGELLVGLVALAAFAGAFLGDLAMYGIGRWAGPRLVRRYASAGSRAERIEWARGQLDRRGPALIAAAQFIPGGRNVVMFTAGTLHFPLPRFLAAEAVGAGLWAVLQTAIGYFGGRVFDDTLTALLASLGVAIALGAVVDGADRLLRRRRRRV
jgi:membrane protein DedA with SNARE-associated domain